jgi:plastocyanin
MHAVGFCLTVGLCCATTAGGVAATDVRGSARSGSRPEVNAVVWLETPNAHRAPQTARVGLDQRNLMFSPHVLAVRVGTVVDFPNNDRVFHNVFSFRDGKRFDLGMYPVGTTQKVTFGQPGLSRIFCNIHPQMAAYIMAVDSPYFSTSDQSGAFTIADVPAERYTYRAWKPGGPILTGSFSPQSATPLDVQWP